MFKVFRLQEFEDLIDKKLTYEERERVEKIEEEIAEVGFTGKPLGLRSLREKRLAGKRVYFIIYDDLKVALMVAVSDKKTQLVTIDKIKTFLPEYRVVAEKMLETT